MCVDQTFATHLFLLSVAIAYTKINHIRNKLSQRSSSTLKLDFQSYDIAGKKFTEGHLTFSGLNLQMWRME